MEDKSRKKRKPRKRVASKRETAGSTRSGGDPVKATKEIRLLKRCYFFAGLPGKHTVQEAIADRLIAEGFAEEA